MKVDNGRILYRVALGWVVMQPFRTGGIGRIPRVRVGRCDAQSSHRT
jgi:hypothetical protein